MTRFSFETIAADCAAFGVPLENGLAERLAFYGEQLLVWNEKMNLTAITAPEEVVIKHFYDCLLFFKQVEVPQGARVIDVGTGAGFPGMVLKLARPDLTVTLLDSLQKRLTFLEEVIGGLGLTGITTVHMRAEDAGHAPALREGFEIACARAVAALPVLAEYCLPLVKPGGVFVAMKGASAEQEAAEAQNAIRLLGGAAPVVAPEQLPGGEKRAFITVKKISQTPTKYPRKPKEMAKQPL